jgi:hypothetical protein
LFIFVSFRPLEGNLWKFDIESLSGERREGVTVSISDELEIEGSRGTANFLIKWPGERDVASIKIIPIKKHDGTYSVSGSFTKILALDCRNVVPVRWIPGEDFVATSSEGHKFEAVDLTDGNWADYDEENDLSVSVMDLEHKISRA